MAKDANGKDVGFGDYCTIALDSFEGAKTVVRILNISDGIKGASAVGGYVSLTGNGRIAKLKFNPAQSELMLKHQSEPTKGK